MPHDVFISYAHQDKQAADAVCAKLEASGVSCWIAPRDGLPGVKYGGFIVDAINNARLLVLVFSHHANESEHILREVELAVHKRMAVLPIRIEDVAPVADMEYFIRAVHWFDAHTPPIEQHLDSFTQAVHVLLSRLNLAAGGASAAAPPAPGEPSSSSQQQQQPEPPRTDPALPGGGQVLPSGAAWPRPAWAEAPAGATPAGAIPAGAIPAGATAAGANPANPAGANPAGAVPGLGHVRRAGRPGVDWSPWRRERIAEWSHPRYRLDSEFVALTLLIDQGEESPSGRWSARPERYHGVREMLLAVSDPAMVLLGPPGSGKSTLLRRLEMDTAQAALDGEDERDTVTFFIQLNQYKAARPGEHLPAPEDWLAERWRTRFPEMPQLPDLLGEGRVLLLLDALNEVPAGSLGGLREAVLSWKAFLDLLVKDRPGNRLVFSCRTLDYSSPLSTTRLRVPQVVIEPMTDEQVERFLVKHSPTRGQAIWSHLKGTQQLEVMRSPYFLNLLLDQIQIEGGIPKGRAGLFTGFGRQVLRREIERDNPLFAPDRLLMERDLRRIVQGSWRTPWELPERGVLIPKLAELAFGMQDRSNDGGASQVRIGYDDALGLLQHELNEDIVRAGVALSILDEDAANDEVLFFHQLIQEYFAGRRLAASPEPERARSVWRVDEVKPALVEVIRSLPPAEVLPPLVTTGWEETTVLAVAMSADSDGFVRGLMATNLALAGRCAAESEVRDRLSAALLNELRAALVERSRNPEADLRARIGAAAALGPLGDPRLERRKGPHGDYLLPPLAEVPSGCYPIGEDEPFEYLGQTIRSHMPRHEVEVAAFRIGRFPVSNAEWALFMEAGGYEGERWWDTNVALRWQRGEGTADVQHANARDWREMFRKDPQQLEIAWKSGQLTEEIYERWKKRLAMTEAEFDVHLREMYPGGLLREPAFWRSGTWNSPSQPVVGICWFEARAYCNWLSAQTGETFRLPTEAEWEAAARGPRGRHFAYGDDFDPLKANTAETRLKRTVPVGVFPEGDTPEGVSDMTGNVNEWTESLFGPGSEFERAPFAYPYRARDGREDPNAGSDVRRVLRGGAWDEDRVTACAALRRDLPPDGRYHGGGFRVAAGNLPSSSPKRLIS